MISTRTIGRTSRAALAFAVTAAFVSAAVVPASASDRQAPKAQEAPKAKETRYCVEGPSTGTLLVRKVCKTREEWIAREGFDPLKSKKN